MTRPSRGRDWLFDELLYSNNSIFNISRSYARHFSHTYGKMTIRGGVVAADLGMFVPGPGNDRGLKIPQSAEEWTTFWQQREARVSGVLQLASLQPLVRPADEFQNE